MSQAVTKKKPTVPKTAVTIDVDLPSIVEGEKTEAYWIGTMPDCPLENIHAGGFLFPRFTGDHITAGGDLIPEHRRNHGIIAHMSEAQVTTVKEAVRLRMVRVLGVDRTGAEFEDLEGAPKPTRKPTAVIIMRDGPKCAEGYKYSPLRGDVPLARFVYMHRAANISIVDGKNWPPHPMEAPKE